MRDLGRVLNTAVDTAERGPAGELALTIADQGWSGLIPVVPPDAVPNVRLAATKAAEVERGRGKAPGTWARAGWSLLYDWRRHPDDTDTIENWSRWPSVNVGLRACARAPWVTFVDVDVLHHDAAAEIQTMLRNRLEGRGEVIWRVGNAPKFLIPLQITEPVTRSRSIVVAIGGQHHMVEVLGAGQQAVVAGVHPKTGRPYFWPAGGLEETEPGKLPLVTPAEIAEILAACDRVLLRYGQAVGRKGRSTRAERSATPKPTAELRARDHALALAAADFVVNSDWTYDDWVAWAFALRGAFGDDGRGLWQRFSEQSAKHCPDSTDKVWRDATQAERDGHLRSGAGTVLAVAKEEGWTPPPSPGLPAYYDAGEDDPATASAALRLAVVQWVEQGLAYTAKGEAPRDAIAGAVGLGKTTITLEALAQMAQARTVHYYAPTLELGEEVVTKARRLGLDARLIRGREANKKDPVRWPSLCEKEDVAATLGRMGRNVWESLCRKEDEAGNVAKCPYFHGCAYVSQFDHLEGRLVVMAHEYLTLPKSLMADPHLVVVDERFHGTLIRAQSLPLERVTADRPYRFGKVPAEAVDALAADAGTAIRALKAAKTMAEVGLTPERLCKMAQHEEMLAEAPKIWPNQPYRVQQAHAQQLQEIEAFRLAKLWRTLAQDHDRVSQRVVLARGIEWKGELQDRVFIHSAADPLINKRLPVLVIDADHDPLIGAATLPTNRRTVIRPEINAVVTQVRDTVCSRNKLLSSPARRADVLALARYEAAQGRRVLLGTYKAVADLLRAELTDQDRKRISVVHFGAIRGLDGFKEYETVIVAGREQPRAVNVENTARSLFGHEPERLLFTGEYVQQMRGYVMKDGTRTAATVEVHPDARVQAVLEQAREREIEQMVGRLRLVHRAAPARVFLLSNLPTALPVDRLAAWAEVMPSKIEQAIRAGRGVLPLSAAEQARVHPALWATAREVSHWNARKGTQVPIRETYWNVGTLSAATVVSYRRAGQVRGSPHRAIIPGCVTEHDPAAILLEAVLGPVDHVTILETIHRPVPAEVISDTGELAHVTVPLQTPARFRMHHIAEAWAFSKSCNYRFALPNSRQARVAAHVLHPRLCGLQARAPARRPRRHRFSSTSESLDQHQLRLEDEENAEAQDRDLPPADPTATPAVARRVV